MNMDERLKTLASQLDQDLNYTPAWERIRCLSELEPDYRIDCELISYNDSHVIAKAFIMDMAGTLWSSAIVSVDPKNALEIDPIGWAITKAIGKALAYKGVGGKPEALREEMVEQAMSVARQVAAIAENGRAKVAEKLIFDQENEIVRRRLTEFLYGLVSEKAQ